MNYVTSPMLHSYPGVLKVDAHMLAATIDALHDCMQSCTADADTRPEAGPGRTSPDFRRIGTIRLRQHVLEELAVLIRGSLSRRIARAESDSPRSDSVACSSKSR